MLFRRQEREKFPYEYPIHLRELAAELPKAPGVYQFHGEEQSVPLYIGKSVDLRTRVLSHLREPGEARMLSQTRRITHVRTAGDLGAQLLEAHQIKTLQPLYNKKLRRTHRICSIALDLGGVRYAFSNEPNFRLRTNLYGLFGSKMAAMDKLRALADEHELCCARIGLERTPGGRPCFRHSIGRCRGACAGKEAGRDHDERLLTALRGIEVAKWPYKGRVAIEERDGKLRQLHVIDHWNYLGSAGSLREARRIKGDSGQFDRHDYYIVARPILSGELRVREL